LLLAAVVIPLLGGISTAHAADKKPNIDRVAREGRMFTDNYAEQSCTAGRASFITGQFGTAAKKLMEWDLKR
jgi:arylsulfatase A-like enzyme